jgi:hypothetical protein
MFVWCLCSTVSFCCVFEELLVSFTPYFIHWTVFPFSAHDMFLFLFSSLPYFLSTLPSFFSALLPPFHDAVLTSDLSMLVESGLALALDGAEIKVGGGLWTPAACQGELLLRRLLNTGSSFSIE